MAPVRTCASHRGGVRGFTAIVAAFFVASLVSVGLSGCGGSEPVDPAGRFTFDAQASLDASKPQIVAAVGPQGAGVVELALGQLSAGLRASEMHFELAPDGELRGHRRQLNPVSGVYLDRSENGTWSRIDGDEGGQSVALELSIVDEQNPDFVETRRAVVDATSLRVTTPMGAGPVTFVYLRAD